MYFSTKQQWGHGTMQSYGVVVRRARREENQAAELLMFVGPAGTPDQQVPPDALPPCMRC